MPYALPPQPPGLYNVAVQHAELRKLKTNPAAALADPFWKYIEARRALDPARFDHYHPVAGPLVGQTEVPLPAPSPAHGQSVMIAVPIVSPPGAVTMPAFSCPLPTPPAQAPVGNPINPPITPPSPPVTIPVPDGGVPEPTSAISFFAGMFGILGWYWRSTR